VIIEGASPDAYNTTSTGVAISNVQTVGSGISFDYTLAATLSANIARVTTSAAHNVASERPDRGDRRFAARVQHHCGHGRAGDAPFGDHIHLHAALRRDHQRHDPADPQGEEGRDLGFRLGPGGDREHSRPRLSCRRPAAELQHHLARAAQPSTSAT
jgi:hypothetical protein